MTCTSSPRLDVVGDARFIVDETSVTARALERDDMMDALADLVEEMELVRGHAEEIAIISGYGDAWDEPDTSALSGDRVGDVWQLRGRALRLLDKCAHLDEDPSFVVEPAVLVAEEARESYGLAAAYERRRAGAGVGVFVLGACKSPLGVGRPGADACAVPAVWDRDSGGVFYQAVIRDEATNDDDFFAHAALAFPHTRFVPGLRFNRFDGDFKALLPQVVRHLGILDRDFIGVYRAQNGRSDLVAHHLGLDISMESPNTRRAPTLMRLREVEFGGKSYVCEWHSKIEPHRNRIHLAIGQDAGDDVVLIGIFVDHLPT